MKRKLVIVFAFVATCAIMLVCREPLVALLSPADFDDREFAEIELGETEPVHREPTALAAGLTSSDSPSGTTEPRTPATRLLLQTANNLASLPSIETDIRHTTNLFGNQLSGTGKYTQAGQETSKSRLELTFTNDDFETNVTQINDGRFLYTITDQSNEPVAKRVDLATLTPDSSAATKNQCTTNWMAMGGLSFLMQQLATDFDFSLSQNRDNEIVLLGTWKQSRLANICGKLNVYDKANNLLVSQLPPQLPTHVKVVLTQNKTIGSIPSQIVWLRKSESANEQSLQTIASFEFHNIRQRDDIPLATFQIEKNVARVSDITESVVKHADHALRLR